MSPPLIYHQSLFPGLARDPEVVTESGQTLEDTPEVPASSKTFAVPVRKEPQSGEGDPSSEPDRVGKGRVVDWGSPQILEQYVLLRTYSSGHPLGRNHPVRMNCVT